MSQNGNSGGLTQIQLAELTKFFSDWQAEMTANVMEFTNKMSFAGYTGAFAVWILLKQHLSQAATDWVGILLLVSLGTFVGWNIFNMVWMATQRLRYNEQLLGLVGLAVRDRFMELEAHTRLSIATRYIPAWWTVVIVCTTTALLAFAILVVTAAGDLLALSI